MSRSRARARAARCSAPALVLLMVGSACGEGLRPSTGDRDAAAFRGPIILISFAALRADAVGGVPSATPRLDRFLAEATWSGTGVASSSWSAGSLASVLTGLPPALHGAGHPAHPWLRREVPTLAEELSAAEFSTRAFYASPWSGPGFGLERGFDVMRPLRRRSAERWLQALEGGPTLTWIQIPLPGVTPAATSDGGAADSDDRSVDAPRGRPRPQRRRATGADAAAQQNSAAVRQEIAAARQVESRAAPPYRERVAGADRRLGRLLDALRRGGRDRDAVVVVLADHGEALDSGQAVPPGHDLGRQSLEVPLALRLPSALAGRIQVPAGSAVGLDRIYATVLELAGLRPLPAAAPSLLRPSEWAAISELWFANAHHEIAVYEDGHQLRWRCRFAPPEAGFEPAWREALDAGGSALYGSLIERLETEFRARPRCAEGEDLTLEAWPAGSGVVPVEDAARRDRMLDRLRALRSFPPTWTVESPPPPPALRRRELNALSGWGLPVPAQWGARGAGAS